MKDRHKRTETKPIRLTETRLQSHGGRQRQWWGALLAAGVLLLGGAPTALANNPQPRQNRLKQQYQNLPLRFETRRSSEANPVEYVARGTRYWLGIAPTKVYMQFQSPAPIRKQRAHHVKPETSDRPSNPVHTLSVKLTGANPDSRLVGRGALTGRMNYLVGRDPENWRTAVNAYGKVVCHQVYPDIDLVYYGNQRQLEYDFVLKPGGKVDSIQMQFKGMDKLEIDESGDLLVHFAGGTLRQYKPYVYQKTEQGRRPVEGEFVLHDESYVGFKVGEYDPDRVLVIDPILNYASFLGADGADRAWDVSVDSEGNAYVVGTTASIEIPNNPGGAFDEISGGTGFAGDAFIAKLNAQGSALDYFTYLGGEWEDGGLSMKLDDAGSVYVVGFTASTNFPVVNAFQSEIQGEPDPDTGNHEFDAFVAKLNSDGSALEYSTYLGGTDEDEALDIAVDEDGNAYVVGQTLSDDFPVMNGLMGHQGSEDIFVSRFNASGDALTFSTTYGGTGLDSGESVDVDSAGNLYVAGLTSSADFATENALQADIGGQFDGHVLKFDHNGQLLFATFWGGNQDEFLYRARLDAEENFTVIGQTFSSGLSLVEPQQADFGGTSDVLLGKVSNDGSEILFSTYLGGSEAESGWDLDFDAAGNLYVAGITRSTDFPIADASQNESGGTEDIFVAKYNPDGSRLLYSTYLGGEDFDNAYGLAVQPGGTVFLAGRSYSTAEFPTTAEAYQTDHGGGDEDGIVAKLLPTPRLQLETADDGQLELSWPSTQPAFELQSVMQLSGGDSWSTVTDSPAVEQGHNVLNPASDEPQRYYRLILP